MLYVCLVSQSMNDDDIENENIESVGTVSSIYVIRERETTAPLLDFGKKKMQLNAKLCRIRAKDQCTHCAFIQTNRRT